MTDRNANTVTAVLAPRTLDTLQSRCAAAGTSRSATIDTDLRTFYLLLASELDANPVTLSALTIARRLAAAEPDARTLHALLEAENRRTWRMGDDVIIAAHFPAVLLEETLAGRPALDVALLGAVRAHLAGDHEQTYEGWARVGVVVNSLPERVANTAFTTAEVNALAGNLGSLLDGVNTHADGASDQVRERIGHLRDVDDRDGSFASLFRKTSTWADEDIRAFVRVLASQQWRQFGPRTSQQWRQFGLHVA